LAFEGPDKVHYCNIRLRRAFKRNLRNELV
jgi:hypothetical protein